MSDSPHPGYRQASPVIHPTGPMTYAETLTALQGMLGELVRVNVGPADPDRPDPDRLEAGLSAGFWGVLRRGVEMASREVEGARLSFQVALPSTSGVGGAFVVSEDVFESADLYEHNPGGPLLTIRAGGMRIGIRQVPRPEPVELS